ncbi:endonuclease III domain-containing protein [Vulcanisaeta thermophila]|uniref:endonuclease III domain-containing protein n=1 Tax=Vulcanisaeta thermophila TaxID=867917 RepID=UPI0009FD39D4|nr:DNA repair protein [Vulcanisaeta thermophila]
MTQGLTNVLKILEGIRDLMERDGWYVDEPGSPRWWGGAESPDEVVITALLVQQTRWEAVVNVLRELRSRGLNTIRSLCGMDTNELAGLLRGVNYRFTKARRLINMACLLENHGGLEGVRNSGNARELLMSIEGVGEETADSIMLFALNIPTLPVSNYTRRVVGRLLNVEFKRYGDWKSFLEGSLPHDLYSYKLFHAGVVTVGKEFCLKNNPQCTRCPLRGICSHALARQSRSP